MVVERKAEEGFGEGTRAHTKKGQLLEGAPEAGDSLISEALIGQIIGDASNREQ